MMNGDTYDRIFQALWTIFSQMNGNPDLHMSAPRFLMSLFFLTLLYLTIRMRAMVQFKKHQIVALVGCVFMVIRECIMLVFLSGWELGLYTDPIIHFLFPPVEHFFSLMAFGCWSWYTVEASQWPWLRRLACTTYVYFGTGLILFSAYALVTWKQFFTQNFPDVLYAYKDSPVDWQTHLIISIIACVGILAAYMRRRGSSYLFWFWLIVLVEHFSRTVTFAFYEEQAWQATVFHAMHTWSIPLLLLHFINAYVLKMSQCAICHQEVFLGKLYWESMQSKNTKEN